MAPPKRTRTIYATISRIAGRAPMIQLKPVTYSLTDGTDIPPPSVEPTPPATPPPPLDPVPESPIDKRNGDDHSSLQAAETSGVPAAQPVNNGPVVATSAEMATEPMPNLDTNQPTSSVSGPLSSNPITPTDPPARNSMNGDFRIPRKQLPAGARPASTTLNGYGYHNRVDSSLTQDSDLTSRPQTAQANMNSASTPQQAQRRPSFVERFFRLRSLSSLRSRSSLGKHSDTTSSGDMQVDSKQRGTKRPASPWSNMDYGMPEEPAKRQGTFPRNIRKKSLELFGSARRMSGMWSRGGDTQAQATIDEEAERERERELERQREIDEWERQREMEIEEERRRREIEAEIMARPPPTLPGLREGSIDGGRVNADELLNEIGR